MEVYDSLGRNNTALWKMLGKWARDEAEAKGCPERQWRVVSFGNSTRQQDNMSDCGVLVLRTMDLLCRGIPIAALVGDMCYYRRRIAAELLLNKV